MLQSNVYVGIKPDHNNTNESNFGTNLSLFPATNFDYVLLPITNQRYREIAIRAIEDYILSHQVQSKTGNAFQGLVIPQPQLQEVYIPPFKPVLSTNKDTGSQDMMYLGLLSSWLDLDSDDMLIKDFNFQVLLNECKYARFIGIKKLILAPPKNLSNLTPYAQTINRLLNDKVFSMVPQITLSISLPLFEDSEPFATWELWNTIRKICDYNELLTISLALPRVKTPSYVLKRWLCEPVSCLLISSSIFETNQYNYPVLHKFNQKVLSQFQRVNGNSQSENGELCVILHGMEKYADYVEGGSASYLDYINYLLKKEDKKIMKDFNNDNFIMTINGDDKNNIENYGTSNLALMYEDSWTPKLMPPLLPNSENLTNMTYSIFENDRPKYDLYNTAIQQAIQDKLSEIQRIKTNSSQKFQICVAGAGRGPLIDETYDILKYYNILNKCKIIAIEKNPQAFLYLQKKKFDKWVDSVELIKDDMKTLNGDFGKFDIVISELLGSFGCNELSPECLLNIETKYSYPETIFIPESYSSYVAPISTPLIRQKLCKIQDGFEQPWILHNVPYCILSSKINEIWKFQHPLLKSNDDYSNIFSKSGKNCEFKLKNKCEIDGLIGFFSAKLYNSVIISTLPENFTVKTLENNIIHNNELYHTKNLKSWEPVVFPIIEPLTITDDTELSIFMNRISRPGSLKTWYEWSLESFIYLVVSPTTNKYINNYNDTKSTTKDDTNYTINQSDYKNGDIHSNNVQESIINQNIPKFFQSEFETGGWESINDIHELTSDKLPSEFNNNNNNNNINALFNLKISESDINNSSIRAEENHQENEVEHEDRMKDSDYNYELEKDLTTSNKNNPAINNDKTTTTNNNNALEINLRIRTGVTKLHNINGKKFSIPI